VTIYSFTWLILSYAEADANLSFSSFPETLANKPPLPHLRPLHLLMEPWKMGTPFIKKVQTGVLNYVVLRPITAVLGFLLEPLGKYTAGDVDPRNAYVYLALINSVSQAWALYCLIQLYRAVSADLTGVRLLAKFVCVKGLVFFTFWQGLLVALLLRLGLIQRALRPHTDTPAMLAVRIQNFLICCEMLFFSVAHAYAFSAAEFFTSSDAPSPSAGPTTAWSVLHALFDWSDLTRNMGAQVTYGAGLPLSELKRVVGARQRAAAARESAARGERDTVPLI
jgi:Organic solute transporter Ostalpha